MKKLVAPIMAAILAASMTVPAMAGVTLNIDSNSRLTAEEINQIIDLVDKNDTVKPTKVSNQSNYNVNSLSFKDVPSSHWAYKPIMNMVNKGIISGTTQPVNGVGTFAPDSPMTRAQFITVVTRYLYPNELKTVKVAEGSAWYAGNYDVAVDMGLIYEHEFSADASVMNQSMTRQEMAMVLVRAMDALGEDTSDKVSKNRIPDYNTIGTHYKDYVRVAYKEGLIAGTDSAGTFNPKGTLTRAQAATVLNRLIDPSTRTPASDVVVDTGDIDTGSVNIGQVTGKSWYEGGKHEGFPKVGDTVIKSDGTKVVLTSTNIAGYEILGYGQGVDFITGLTVNGVTIKRDNLCRAWSGYGAGNDRSQFMYDPISNETHTQNEWAAIASNYPEKAGSYDGEIANTYFKWHAGGERWMWMGPKF